MKSTIIYCMILILVLSFNFYIKSEVSTSEQLKDKIKKISDLKILVWNKDRTKIVNEAKTKLSLEEIKFFKENIIKLQWVEEKMGLADEPAFILKASDIEFEVYISLLRMETKGYRMYFQKDSDMGKFINKIFDTLNK